MSYDPETKRGVVKAFLAAAIVLGAAGAISWIYRLWDLIGWTRFVGVVIVVLLFAAMEALLIYAQATNFDGRVSEGQIALTQSLTLSLTGFFLFWLVFLAG